VLASMVLFGGAGALIMSIGALVSVSGSDESNILGTARLSYAMAIDGLFPRAFAKLHPRYRTPYLALAIQAVIAFVLSTLSGITGLITFAVFNLAVSFLLTCLALIVLQKPAKRTLYGQGILPWLGVFICGYLLYSASLFDKVVGTLVLLLGVPLYIFFSPKTDIHHLKELVFSEERIFARRFRRQERFLANLLRLVRGAYLQVVRRARSGTR
jgi:APA family basic amino acid/polyamine antiporter